jgi:hypothetical protein
MGDQYRVIMMAVSCSITPRIRAARRAPGRLPMPPRTMIESVRATQSDWLEGLKL